MQAIWAKGYTELLDLIEKDHATAEMHTAIDCYGYGDDLHEAGYSISLAPLLVLCSSYGLLRCTLRSIATASATPKQGAPLCGRLVCHPCGRMRALRRMHSCPALPLTVAAPRG